MSLAEAVGIAELAPLETWQQVPLALLLLTFWGMLVKILTTPDGEERPSAPGTNLQMFGSYFSSLAGAATAGRPSSQKLTAVAVDSKEVAALLKALQTANDRLQKEACGAIVEAIMAADAAISEAVKANPYVEPPPVEPEEVVAEPAAAAVEEEVLVEEEVPVEEAPVEEAAEEVEVAAAAPSKKTKKKKEKAQREAAPSPEPSAEHQREPTVEEVLAVVEAAEAEEQAEVFQEPAKQKKKKNRKKKLEEQPEEDEEEDEAEAGAGALAVDAEFVPVAAHPEEPEEVDEEQAEEAADQEQEEAEEEEAEEEEEDQQAEEEAVEDEGEEAEDAEGEEEEEEAAEEEGAEEGAAKEEDAEPQDDEVDDEDDEEAEGAEEEAAEQGAEEAGEEAAQEAAEEVDAGEAGEAEAPAEDEEEWEPPPPQPPTQLQKDILKVKKKIREIEELEAKQEGGATLSANQVEKVGKKEGLLQELDDLENTPEPHTIQWNGTVVELMRPLVGVKVKVEGQGPDKGPFPLLAAHMNPPVAFDDLQSIATKYPKGSDLKVRVLRNGENISDMSVEDEEKKWKQVKSIADKLAEFQKEDERVTNMLWENCGTWSDDEYTGTTTSVKDFGVFVLLEFGRYVLVRPDDLKSDWRFKDPTTNLARPKRDLVKPGMTVQVRLKYVDNPKKDENDNYYGSMIVSK